MNDDAPHSTPTDPAVMPPSPPYAREPEPPWGEPSAPSPPPTAGPPTAGPPTAGPPTAWQPPASPPWNGWPPPPTGWPPPTDWPPRSPTPPPRRSASVVVVLVAVLALVAGAIGMGLGASLVGSGSGATATRSPFASTDTSSSAQALPTPNTDSNGPALSSPDIAAKVDPAIVDINVTFTVGNGAGTGMVLTSTGIVLTNNHVIANATKIDVETALGGRHFDAAVLGYDIADDVALLQLKDASGLPAVSVSDSSAVATGDRVVALGNALGHGGTPAVAEGDVRSLNQSIDVSNDDGSTSRLSGLIETSARLQPGDSGGPLVDESGDVIGMDVAATTSSRGRTTNDSFAIPINTALDVARRIESGQSSARIHVGERALLGVQANGSGRPTVASVEPGSPAEGAGLAAGDTITSVDGTQVSSVDDLVAALDPHHPGDSVSVTWLDPSGHEHTETIELISGPPA